MRDRAKKLHIKTYGCQMNVYDSDRMTDALAGAGYEATDRPEGADLIILNTCHIRERAAEKVYSELGRLRALKEERARAGLPTMVAVAGCVAQAEGAEIIHRASVVDLVFGPQTYHELPALLARAAVQPGVVETGMPAEDKFERLPVPAPARAASRGHSAFLTVQEGCDKFCTFCVVPYTRGAESSRPVRQILAEAERLAEAGVREITLLGQNVNAYHGRGDDGQDWSLARLLGRLAEIPGLFRLRYTTSHPRDMADDLIAAHRDLAALMPFLHLPVQSGSDAVLKRMNRRHGRAEYLRLVERIRAARPDIALSSDFIVGFPGESEEDFAATLDLVEEVGFAQTFSFKYSPRPGTPAADLEGQVGEEIKTERLHRLQALLARQQAAFNLKTVGRTLDVLLERDGRHPGQLAGKSPYLQAVQLEAPATLKGEVVPVVITGTGTNSLFATLAGPREAASLEGAMTA